MPKTVLLSEVKPGERYELVITSFHGMPFIRYRLGHLIRISALEDSEASIDLPQMVFESRADDLIDVAGFTRIAEKTILKAISASGIQCEDWIARKEIMGGKPALHIYIETGIDCHQEDLAETIHNEMIKVDAGYRDLAGMMEIYPLQVTSLKRGSFNNYSSIRHKAGYELAMQRPLRMNALEEDIQELMGVKAKKLVHAR